MTWFVSKAVKIFDLTTVMCLNFCMGLNEEAINHRSKEVLHGSQINAHNSKHTQRPRFSKTQLNIFDLSFVAVRPNLKGGFGHLIWNQKNTNFRKTIHQVLSPIRPTLIFCAKKCKNRRSSLRVPYNKKDVTEASTQQWYWSLHTHLENHSRPINCLRLATKTFGIQSQLGNINQTPGLASKPVL